MDIALYIPTMDVYGEDVPLTLGVAYFDLMGNNKPIVQEFPSLSSSFAQTLQRLVSDAERVWIGPNMGAALALYAFSGLAHPQLRDSDTLFSLVPHMPAEYFQGAGPGANAATMVARLRSCVDALLISGL